jgi:hypothetical protein
VQSHTPLQIKEANSARLLMNKRAQAAGKKKKACRLIHDDRAVRQPLNGYGFFFKERNDSGDLSGMSVAERGKLVGQEWKNLSEAQKKVCFDEIPL